VRYYKSNEQVIFQTLRENTQYKCWEKDGRKWCYIGDISKKCNKTAAPASAMVKKLYGSDHEAKPNSVNWSCYASWKTDNKLILFSDEACRHLGGYVTQSNKNSLGEIPCYFTKFSFIMLKVSAWWVMTATTIIGFAFYWGHVYISHVMFWRHFLNTCLIKTEPRPFYKQDITTAKIKLKKIGCVTACETFIF